MWKEIWETHIAMQRNPLWQACPAAVEKSVTCSIERSVSYVPASGGKHGLCFLSPLLWQVTLSFSAIRTQDRVLQLERGIFSLHALTLSQTVSKTLVRLVPIKYTGCWLTLKHGLKGVRCGLDATEDRLQSEWNHEGEWQSSIFIFYLLLRFKLK